MDPLNNINIPKIKALFGTAEIWPFVQEYISGDVLDFGAGTAKQRSFISVPIISYTSLDIVPGPFIDIVADVLDPPLPDESFDTIISNQVIEHVKQPFAMVKQAARLLKKDGHLIITAPFLAPFHADPNDFFRFTENGIKELCHNANLEIVLCTKYGGMSSVMLEFYKQSIMSPYAASRPSWVKRRCSGFLYWLFRQMNIFFPPNIIYSSVLCVARKQPSS